METSWEARALVVAAATCPLTLPMEPLSSVLCRIVAAAPPPRNGAAPAVYEKWGGVGRGPSEKPHVEQASHLEAHLRRLPLLAGAPEGVAIPVGVFWAWLRAAKRLERMGLVPARELETEEET